LTVPRCWSSSTSVRPPVDSRVLEQLRKTPLELEELFLAKVIHEPVRYVIYNTNLEEP
jgi:hypothetical protein